MLCRNSIPERRYPVSKKFPYQPFHIALLTAVILLGTVLLPSGRVEAAYVLTGATDAAVVLNGQNSSENAEDFRSQTVFLQETGSGYEAILQDGISVTVHTDGDTFTATAQNETVSGLLQRIGVTPGPMDTVLVDVSGESVDVTIGSDLIFYDHDVVTTAYETVRIPTPDLPQGSEQVVQAGINGTFTDVYEVVYSGGEEVSRQLVEQREVTVVNEIVEYGTAAVTLADDDRIATVEKNKDGSGILTFNSGATLKFSAARTMSATAYTTGYDGVGTITASGTVVHVGSVAVDKKVIPLGTRLYILTEDGYCVYGLAVAEDTGVFGNKVDLFFDTYNECIRFGRRPATVYILED